MKLIEEMDFDHSFSFVYSPRPGTPAAELPDNTPHEIKLERLQRLQAQIEQQAQAMSQRMVGTTQRILVSGASKKDSSEFCGYTDNNRMVSFVGSGGHPATGHLINVKIATAMARSLRGELCSPSV